MNNNNNKNIVYKALTTEVSKHYNTQNRLMNNYISNKTKNKPTNYNTYEIYTNVNRVS